MSLLLDTHTVLWMVFDDDRLSPRARKAILEEPDLAWSIASLWEIGIKASLHRPSFQIGPGWARLIPEEMTRNGIRSIEMTAAHCEAVSRLPWHHRDPFDRLFVAMASVDGLTLLSRDDRFDTYGIQRVW